MITARAETVSRDVKSIKGFAETRTIAARLQSKAEQLLEDRNRIEAAVGVLNALQERKPSDYFDQALQVADSAVVPLENILEDPDKCDANTVDGEDAWRDLLRDLHALAERLSQLSQAAWADYVTSIIPPDHGDILRAFRIASPEVVQSLHAQRGNMRQKWGTMAPDAVQIDDLEDAVAKYNMTFQELLGENVPESLLEFLKSAATVEGVPLGAVSADIVSWLSNRSILDAFKVRL